ncbi:hypothetical protein NBRC116599_17540 [Aquicoccus sp. SU-CL01552]
MITQVPDRVTRWFGQGGEQLNEERDSQYAVGILNSQAESRIQQVTGSTAAKGAASELKATNNGGGAGGDPNSSSSSPERK